MLPIGPHHPHRRGVTLIEVVIAIFVLSVGILGILSLFPTGYRLTKKSVDRSVAALAARHAMARVYGRINNIKAPKRQDEPLASVSDPYRVGTVLTVNQNSLVCRVLGNKPPGWPGGLSGYYVVMTSGSAEGHLYPISGCSGDELTTSVRFNQGSEQQYEPVRVGDTFAVIGIKTSSATRCYPEHFLGGALEGTDPLGRPADPESNETRTMPVATYGAPNQPKDLWRYSYGCILTVPPPERPDTCRLDVFVYNGFPYRAESAKYPDPSVANSIIVGHYVTYIAAGRDTY
ncbi:MAG TPA: prepilin-type N-terminal cleavage/methylation domain-containing protein [Planctomycetota bacterium]|nr:prepilin-type N-terminal cleavage/methylation domain-containing protein [Planctomycetota bacterium]